MLEPASLKVQSFVFVFAYSPCICIFHVCICKIEVHSYSEGILRNANSAETATFSLRVFMPIRVLSPLPSIPLMENFFSLMILHFPKKLWRGTGEMNFVSVKRQRH